MQETQLTDELAEIIHQNHGLTSYLRNLELGRDETPRSNMYNMSSVKELTGEEVLTQWTNILSSLEDGDIFERNVLNFDVSQTSKYGPQGKVAPISDLLEECVYPTFSGNKTPSAFSTPEWKQAKSNIIQLLTSNGIRGLRPASFTSVVNDMANRDTLFSNSGFPDFTRRNKPDVKSQAISDASSDRWKTFPAIALFRNYNQKTRLVWMFPMATNLVEGSFVQPLQKALRRFPTTHRLGSFFSPWEGFDQVRLIVGDNYSLRGKSVAASDFSSTDAHFQLATTLEVFSVIQFCFQTGYREALKESLVHMHSIPLLIGKNAMLTGQHGVASGSNWTNLIETIFDLIFSEYVSILYPQASGLYAIGDDMAWLVEDDLLPQFPKILEELGEAVGQVIKEEKTMADPDKVKSLQRLFQRNYFRSDQLSLRGCYSTVRALKSLIYPERFHNPKNWSKDMEAVRAFSILENCIDHPLFTEFCDFAFQGDPYLCEFAKQSDSVVNKNQQLSHRLVGLNTTYNQEKRDKSLAAYEGIKYARKINTSSRN